MLALLTMEDNTCGVNADNTILVDTNSCQMLPASPPSIHDLAETVAAALIARYGVGLNDGESIRTKRALAAEAYDIAQAMVDEGARR